ncbi:helix-turn-helix domain-containing protein [Herbiconiux sp.]|uniref:helix-turn-helix domain-containing protein n=1 Tax=Herbiconiux sp. TaxID=1871186 RepID=UPI0025BBA1C0|nr:helix-turn-helix domain-containing protein [Herbiconiux sp.]
MQELVGRLTALDATATESLKVISYFDALVDGHANVEVLLRGAAILSGCAAGFSVDGRTVRVDDSGARRAGPPGDWASHAFGDGGRAWIERDGAPHTNDAMILERLALALDIAVERTSPTAASRRALESVLDPDSTAEARSSAIARLRLDAGSAYRAVAVPASTAWSMTDSPSVVLRTPVGSVRALILEARAANALDRAGQERMGIGPAVAPEALDTSWASALVALRLTSLREPVQEADRLGVILALAESEHAARTAPDVDAVAELIRTQPQLEPFLDALAEAESVRAAAQQLRLHHSTVQAKVTALEHSLGFDVRTPRGRVRLTLALALHRLAQNRFD